MIKSRHSKVDRVLDALASRLGIVLVIGLLIGGCLAAGLYVSASVRQLERDHALFHDKQIRNGYVAMSDVQRLVIVAQEAFYLGFMSEELKVEFQNAADFIFVRLDTFGSRMTDISTVASGEASVQALAAVLELADTAIQEDFPDVDQLLADVLEATEVARINLIQFLDDMRLEADVVLNAQSKAVKSQQLIVIANLAGLTFVGSIAVLLLRREVLGRHAREKAEERVAFLAYFDQLTGLPNRSQFQGRIQSMLEEARTLALLFIDVDDFKSINDTYGHGAGDEVLQTVGNCLLSLSKDLHGFAARLGGDEFAVVVPTDDFATLAALCEDILSADAKPFHYEGETIEIRLSIGASTTTQVNGKMPASLDMLSRVTDFALYDSKSKGKNQYSFYDHDLEQKFIERRAMIDELPRAIEQGKLEIHFQPKTNLRTGEVPGFEALVRWKRGDRLVPPMEFIRVAEESGLVLALDRHVMQESAKAIAAWNAASNSELGVSVNLSALHFGSKRIVSWVSDVIDQTDLPPGCLTLEVTETAEMRDWSFAKTILRDLKQLGVRIAIDDFGTGYSSLAYLQATMADELKIDRSLINQIETSEKSRLLLASVLDIASNMELQVVVEGVETVRQARILLDMGVTTVQGFLFGRPQPIDLALRAGATPIQLSETKAS